MFIAGGLTLQPFFSYVDRPGFNSTYQQMDLTVDPVYRRRYKFSQIDSVRLRCTNFYCHQMSTSEDIDLKLRQNIEHLKLRQDIEHVSLERFQRDYES